MRTNSSDNYISEQFIIKQIIGDTCKELKSRVEP
jgi:hypothetical protein